MEPLAAADAFGSLGLTRREALWAIRTLGDRPLPLFEFGEAAMLPGSNHPPIEAGPEPDVSLPTMTTGENVVKDYREVSLTLRAHPLALLRPHLKALGSVQAQDLKTLPENKRIKLAGLVLVRQRPGTASGVIFATIEDETGVGNIIIWPKVFERYRKTVLGSRLLLVEGKLQREGLVIHLVADHLHDHTPMLSTLSGIDLEGVFDGNIARADEVKRPPRDINKLKGAELAFAQSRDFK